MSQITALISGSNQNYDYQLTALARSLVNPGVLSGLAVTSGAVAPGEGFILCTRTNGQKIMVHYTNTASVAITTSGTTKVWVGISQSMIDDWSTNAVDGTGIATIQTGASYPVTGAYIPLAIITSGVIADDRVMLTAKNIFRKGFSNWYILDIVNGIETEKQLVSSAVINDTDSVRFKLADWSWKEVLFTALKSLLSTAWKYVQTTTLWESIPANVTSLSDDILATTSQVSFALTTIFNYSGPWEISKFNFKLTFWGSSGASDSWNIVGSWSNDWWATWTPIWTTNGTQSGISPGVITYSWINPFSTFQQFTQYKFVVTTIWSWYQSWYDAFYKIQFTSPLALAVVWNINYLWTLTAWTGSAVKRGIRIQVPYAGKLGIVKTSKVSSSSSATIQIRDDSDVFIKEVSVASWANSADMNYTFTAWQIFRLVMNDSANFTSSADYLALATFQAFFPYAISGTTNNVTDATNCLWFWEINIDFLWKAFKARANRAIELPFAIFSWFAFWPLNAWDAITLDSNDNTYTSWFVSLIKEAAYFISNVWGIISTVRWTLFSTIGFAKETTGIIVDRSWVGMKWTSSSSSSAAFWATIYIANKWTITAFSISGSGQIWYAPPGSNTYVDITTKVELGSRVIPWTYKTYGASASLTIIS